MRRTSLRGARWSGSPSQLLLLALTATNAAALTQEYCASFNTGSAKQAPSSNYMSNGKCQTQCSGYAFAVVQFKDCWCSNIAPGGAQSGSACSQNCPGFPSEKCGDPDQGLFGYVALGPAPQGTSGGSQSSSSTSQEEDSSTYSPTPTPTLNRSPVSVQDTVTETPSVKIVTPTTTLTPSVSTSSRFVPVSISLDRSTSTPTPTTTSSSSSSSSSTWTPTPVVTLETVTGKVKTMTVTPTSPPQSTETVVNAVASPDQGGFFSSPGKVAGTFVAVALILVALLAGLGFFLWRRKKRSDAEAVPSTAGSGTPQRRPSRMSQMGLLGADREGKALPQIQTGGWGPGTSGEKSPADTLDKRSSYPRVVDQRLEPTAVWNPLHDNGSHVSVRSFRDDQDYSRRMLRVANPG